MTYSGTHQDLLQNLLRNFQSLPDLLRNLLQNPDEPSLALHQNLPDLLRNLLQNPDEPSLALRQSLPDFLRNLLRNPVEPDLALHQSLPDLLQNLLRNPVELDLALHQSLPHLPPRPSREPSEPSPEPRWTWPGACTSAHQSCSGLKTPLAYAVGEKPQMLGKWHAVIINASSVAGNWLRPAELHHMAQKWISNDFLRNIQPQILSSRTNKPKTRTL